jgi:hypothetical protein
MSAKIFYPVSEKLKFLLESIDNREIALPDFQRNFVWDASATQELIESICRRYPAGTLLRIQNSGGFYFEPRAFAGAKELNGKSPSYLILDGQQRLTSLYQALYGKGAYRYFLDFGGLLEGKDLDACLFHLRLADAIKKYPLERQAARLTFPLHALFGAFETWMAPKKYVGFEEWMDLVLEGQPDPAQAKVLKPRLRKAREDWLDSITEYEFPIVELAPSTTPEAVCTIFETLNRTGVKLSVFDLLTARFRPRGVNLRELWRGARHSHPILEQFELDPYYVLQVVALLTATGAPSCKRGDLLGMTTQQITCGWDSALKGTVEALKLLREECGVLLTKWLPYNTIVIPFGALMAAGGGIVGPAKGAMRQTVLRWFWCSVFTQRYESSPNSQAAKDYSEVKARFAGPPEPEAIEKFAFDPAILRETGPRQRALYRGVIALVMRHGARDFHNGNKIEPEAIQAQQIDDHHIFPRAWLAGNAAGTPVELQECVLNKTLIDTLTNIRIGMKAPSVYLKEIEDEIGAEQLKNVLDSHLLPSGSDSALRKDDFEGFIKERQALIEAEVKQVTG